MEKFEGVSHADKGLIDEFIILNPDLIIVVTPHRKNMKATLSKTLLKFCKNIRKRVENVGSQLTGGFKTDHIRVHDIWHFEHRLIRKILTHIVKLNL